MTDEPVAPEGPDAEDDELEVNALFAPLKSAAGEEASMPVDREVVASVKRLEGRVAGSKPFIRIVFDLLNQATNLLTGLVMRNGTWHDPDATDSEETPEP